jgi:methylmalonyl-CoA mutase
MGSPFRLVTASSLYDGHDASINVIRRFLQKAGCEVIHIGHNRSVEEIVDTALQEGADAVAVSSYQGGHMEFFRYMKDRLKEKGGDDIQIFSGGGGTILPQEIQELENYGITKIYHADEGRKMGLEGMMKDLTSRLKKQTLSNDSLQLIQKKIETKELLSFRELAHAISYLEQGDLSEASYINFLNTLKKSKRTIPIFGITGPGGAGKSSLVDEWVTRLKVCFPEIKIAILAFDPSKRKTGGALLGDRIRMNSIYSDRIFLRSMSTRGEHKEVGDHVLHTLDLMKQVDFDLIILETTGIGQGDMGVVEVSDLNAYVMTGEYGASSQLEKIDMIDFADLVVLNKGDKQGAEDAFEDVLHAYAHSRDLKVREETRQTFPVFLTIASNFADKGVTQFFKYSIEKLREKGLKTAISFSPLGTIENEQAFAIIPSYRSHYLSEIAETIHNYKKKTEEFSKLASHLYQLEMHFKESGKQMPETVKAYFEEKIKSHKEKLGIENLKKIEEFEKQLFLYKQEYFEYTIRDKTFQKPLFIETLSETKVPKIAVPKIRDWGSILTFMNLENFPGHYPFTAGVFPLKSDAEDPKRQFAGEGGPSRTNTRFHFLSRNDEAKRLSTAFDSVTLYGEDPSFQPDIYGKVGNSGVSIATLDHMKTLYKGFDLTDPLTSVSLTINGPAPMILAMFLNTAIDFEVKKITGKEREEISQQDYEVIRSQALTKVRGTVQADILKEEQGQNTCIFSSKFALKLMGDIQEYFIEKNVRNFYSVSISGYHIAEAGANPITQLALTLSNGFTYVEYYLSRGMEINDFAPNLSYFFSCGLDPEYSVMGRVARRIWAITLKERYGANLRSCKLKYHIQTSGRSLHAQEIAFNDIRTTLQALIAYFDFCNSLHTNAYDEAITTPTEESVRRAMAIQLIIAKEFGLAKCDNAMQGSFFYDELTDLVEEAVLKEFQSISRRGGVLGAMEKGYQRHKIQAESMKYEIQKSTGQLPLIGINTFTNENTQIDYENLEVVRATEEEKQEQIQSTHTFVKNAGIKNQEALNRLKRVVLDGQNIFQELMETVKYASLGQITSLLYTCGGKYRRSM